MNNQQYFIFILLAACPGLSAMEQGQSNMMIDEQKSESTVSVQDCIKLITNDGHEFIVPKESAMFSGTIKSMFTGFDQGLQLDEIRTQEIRFGEIIDGTILETIFRLLSPYKRNPKNGKVMLLEDMQFASMNIFLNSLSVEDLKRLILTIDFLDIEVLLDATIPVLIDKIIEEAVGTNLNVDMSFYLEQDGFCQTIQERLIKLFPDNIMSRVEEHFQVRYGQSLLYNTPVYFVPSTEQEQQPVLVIRSKKVRSKKGCNIS